MSKVPNNSPRQLQRIYNKYDDSSLWSKITKGPLGFSFYAAFQYPKVFLNKFFFDKPLNPTWTIHQESFINILKWTLDAPLTTIRSNFIFLEYIMKLFGCSEPYTPLKGIDGVKGYWLGPALWKGCHPEAIVLYVHGGGYVAMSAFFGIRFLCYLIKQLRIQHNIHIRVLSIDYNLAPEEPFPSGLNCVKKAYKWLTEESNAPSNQNIFLCGDSSGASMILGLLQIIYSTDEPEHPNNNNYNISNDDMIYYNNKKNSNDSNDNENNNNDGSSQQFFPSIKAKSPLAGVILISPWVELSCDKLTNSKYDYLQGQFTSISAENYLFGNIGNPNRLQNLYHQPINEPLILSWLEKVEDSFDFVGIDDPDYYNLLPSSSSSITSKRYSADSRTVNITHKRFSKTSQRTSKDSYKTPRGSFRSLRNSKIRDSSSLSVIFNSNSCLNNDSTKTTTKVYMYNSSNNTNEEFSDLDGTITTTNKSNIQHTTTLHQIIEKNKIEISRKQQVPNDIYVNPMVSPLHIKNEILAKFPPLFISYGGKEVFKDDIEKFCKKCVESKNYFDNSDENNHSDVTVETDPEMVHAYPVFIDAFGKHSKNTLDHIAGFISSKISSPQSTKLSLPNNNIK